MGKSRSLSKKADLLPLYGPFMHVNLKIKDLNHHWSTTALFVELLTILTVNIFV